MMRRFDPIGSTANVSFATRKPAVPTEKSEISHVTLDGQGGNTWEQILALECERHPEVMAYVKNEGLGFEIPYVYQGRTHAYRPDFLVRLKPREADGGIVRTLIVEVSGGRKSPGPTNAKADTALNQWCPAVNNHGGFGRWGYIENNNNGRRPRDAHGSDKFAICRRSDHRRPRPARPCRWRAPVHDRAKLRYSRRRVHGNVRED
jgi:type III restriction enzyme